MALLVNVLFFAPSGSTSYALFEIKDDIYPAGIYLLHQFTYEESYFKSVFPSFPSGIMNDLSKDIIWSFNRRTAKKLNNKKKIFVLINSCLSKSRHINNDMT